MDECDCILQYWRQLIHFARFSLPVLFYMVQLSLIDIISSSTCPLPLDLPNFVFAVAISGYYLSYVCLTPSFYRARNKYVAGVMEILLQILVVDVTLRLVTVPFYYVVYYLCVNGYVASFVNHCLFFLYTVDGQLPVSKFVRMSTTEEGFEIVRYLIADFIILWGLFEFGVPQFIINTLINAKNYIVFYVIPILQELIRKDRRKYSGKKKRICVDELEIRRH